MENAVIDLRKPRFAILVVCNLIALTVIVAQGFAMHAAERQTQRAIAIADEAIATSARWRAMIEAFRADSADSQATLDRTTHDLAVCVARLVKAEQTMPDAMPPRRP